MARGGRFRRVTLRRGVDLYFVQPHTAGIPEIIQRISKLAWHQFETALPIFTDICPTCDLYRFVPTPGVNYRHCK